MSDVRLVELAASQHRCVTREQLLACGYSDKAIDHRRETGRLLVLHTAVFGVAPILPNDADTARMAATLMAPDSFLSHAAAVDAFGFWPFRQSPPLVVTRHGDGGPCWIEGVLVHRSRTLVGETARLRGIPITTPERAAIDVAAKLGPRPLARLVREAIRLKLTDPDRLFAALYRHKGRRGTRRLAHAVADYAGLPYDRARSDPELLAMKILRDAGVTVPLLNVKVAGEEADLVWPSWRLIIEIDGPQWHLDAAEDARKQRIWEAAGFVVRRLPSDDVYVHPERLIALATPPNVAHYPL